MLTTAILAGGLATRLRPATEKIPKSLLEVNGEPFIAHQLRLLRASGIDRVVLCVGFLGELIQRKVGDGERFGVRVDYSFDGPVLLGTAGAVRNALPKLGASFFVMYGDSYLPCDYAAVARSFESSGSTGLMTVFRNEGKWDTSNVEFEAGKILAYSKTERTPRMKFIDYGLGVFRAEAFRGFPANEPCDLAGLYQDLLRGGELAAFEVKERFYEIGSPEGLRETAEFISRQEMRAAT
ncbi:MAG TPA: nucleotidyltransferase family protein [Candidatus Binatia bacterium]|nr:nucleotidyltransferase family protein [Candidatus Binatia bacterium]